MAEQEQCARSARSARWAKNTFTVAPDVTTCAFSWALLACRSLHCSASASILSVKAWQHRSRGDTAATARATPCLLLPPSKPPSHVPAPSQLPHLLCLLHNLLHQSHFFHLLQEADKRVRGVLLSRSELPATHFLSFPRILAAPWTALGAGLCPRGGQDPQPHLRTPLAAWPPQPCPAGTPQGSSRGWRGRERRPREGREEGWECPTAGERGVETPQGGWRSPHLSRGRSLSLYCPR